MKVNNKTIKFLKKLLKHLEYYNKMSPFPVYDTDYVKDVKNKINEMNESKKDYDELPVVACKYCKSLHIVSDELENDICMRCGSVNELKEFKNIHEYEKFVKNKE
jgi:Mn-dependent DtxR family transcriptional regulator